MGEKIKKIIKNNPLIKGSFVVLLGSMAINLGTYLYHLLMGRMLGPADYGALASLISILYFLGVPTGVLSLTLVKYISQESKNKKKLTVLINAVTKKICFLGFICLLVFLCLFPALKNLVKIDSFLLFAGIGILGYLGIFLSIYFSIMQGIMKFVLMSINGIFSSWSKLFLSVLLVFLGFKVNGVIAANILATILTLLLCHFLIKKYINFNFLSKSKTDYPLGSVFGYSTTVLIGNLSLISFFTIDIILARYFLSPWMAGQYASLSVLGKIIFFASSPVNQVMFPMISEKKANHENYHKLLWLSLIMVLAISSVITLIYFLFPSLMINLLFGKEYLGGAGNLGLFAIFISLYSICSLLIYYYLSVSAKKIINLSFIFVFVQIALIYLFHSSISQIVVSNIITLSLLLLTLLVYYFKNDYLIQKNST